MLKGLPGLGDLAKVMKQAKELEAKMSGVQENLKNLKVVGKSGAGLVKVTAAASGDFESIEIDPSILREDEKEVVEDLILAAVRDAQTKASDLAKQEMMEATDGLDLPNGIKLPF